MLARTFGTSTRAALLVAATLVALAGCGEDPGPVMRGTERSLCLPPSPDASVSDGGSIDASSIDASMDAGVVCGDTEVCVQGRCVALCTNDSMCAAGQMCAIEGYCVAAMTLDASIEAGIDGAMDAMREAGPDMCMGVFCTSGACLPRLGVCVQCTTSEQCSGATPICNVARAACVAFTPRICGPCNTDVECAGVIVEGTEAHCVERYDTYERVCAIACPADRACPIGFECDSELFVCVPKSSCEQFNAAQEMRNCSADTECSPLGVPPTVGSCGGGGMPGVQGRCRQSCVFPGDCPTGFACTGGFCVAS